ncbi:NADH kinase isoform X2 [Abrus precatorius]|uniref:NADH kinase n=1 Tax=Abrus precatorius TaxID=3816 RepID=A0A8B8KGC6_ABRPR|nr:NADH kinase isoform X2 [Abrus precatorius]
MVMKRLLLLLKPLSVSSQASHTHPQPQILQFLESRHKVHNDAINFCQAILQKKSVEWKAVRRNNLFQPINDVDLVVTVGGDGTLLQASHFMDDKIPVLGLNSDPTQIDEVEQLNSEFDATRSTGQLCAATVENFEQVLDGILEGQIVPSELTRIMISVNALHMSKFALNDILIAHPCPASLSTFSFRITKGDQPCSPLVNCRSSGLRVSTAAGSTAAMHSAGGFPMPILSQDLQYMVREPISPGALSDFMHGLIKHEQTMDTTWTCKKGVIYVDGSHVKYTIQDGDIIEISSKAPILKVFLPHQLLLVEKLR